MAVGLSALRTRGPYDPDAPVDSNSLGSLQTTQQLTPQEQFAANPDGEFTKGLRLGAAGISSGGDYLGALFNKDDPVQRAEAERISQNAQMYAPRVGSLRDVHDVQDAIDYAQGAIGQGTMSMVPGIAAAAITRGQGGTLSKLAAQAGAMVPAFYQEAGEQAQTQYQDPKQMAAPIEERQKATLAKAGINSVLESAVPGALGHALLRKPVGSFLGHVGKEALEEGATEAAQQAVQFGATKYIDPTAQLDPWDIVDAAAGGALSGGALSAGVHGLNHGAATAFDSVEKAAKERAAQVRDSSPLPGPTDVVDTTPTEDTTNPLFAKASEAFNDAKEKFGPELDKVKDVVSGFADRVTEAGKDTTGPADFLSKVFAPSHDDLTEADATGDDSHLAGGTFEETEANINRNDEAKVQRAAQNAKSLLDDPSTPDDVKARVGAYQDFSDPEAQSDVNNTLLGQRTAQKTRAAVDGLIELGKTAVTKLKPVVTDAFNAAKAGAEGVKDRIIKQNLQDATPAEQAAMNKVVFDGLTDSAKSDPDIRAKLPAITNTLMAFAAKTGDLSSKDLPTLTKMSDALSVFADPTGVAKQIAKYAGVPRFEDSFLSKIQSIKSAESDIQKPNSFLVSSLSPEAASTLTTKQLSQLAKVIDTFTLQDKGKKSDTVIQGLSQAFGSPEATKQVLDYYAQQNRGDMMKFDPNEMLAGGQMTEKAAPAATYSFKNAKAQRPFSTLRGSIGGVKESSRAAGDLRTTLGPDAKVEAVPYSQHVLESGKNPEAEVKRVAGDIKERIKKLSKRTDEDRTAQINDLKGELSAMRMKYKEGGAKAALDLYEVLRSGDVDPNDLVATDEDLSKFGTHADAEEYKPTRITFQKKDGTKLMLSAENMWKSQGTKEGSGKGEGGQFRTKRLFSEAVASVLARPDIEKLLTPMEKVTIDRKTGITATKKNNPEYREKVVAGLKAADANIKDLKETLRNRMDEYADIKDDNGRREAIEDGVRANVDQLTQRLADAKDGEGPLAGNVAAQAVARKKLSMYKDAQQEISAVKFEEGLDEDKAGMPGEETGPVGPSKLNRTQMNEELKNPGARNAKEDAFVSKQNAQETKESSMNPKKGRAGKIDKQSIIDEIRRIRGKDVQILFKKFADIGASGQFSMNADRTNRLIEIAVNSLDPMSVAWHESLHDFFNTLGTSKEERQLKVDLLAAADAPQVKAKLRDLLAAHPKALAQIEKDPEERLAYMYQFWASGAMPLGKTSLGIFEKIAKFLREALGVLSEDEKTEALFEALHEGKFSDPSLVASALEDLGAHTLNERIKKVTGPIGEQADKLLLGATDRMRAANVPALNDLADKFYRETGKEQGGELPFLQRRSQTVAKNLNRLQDMLDKTSATERRSALENMQAMKTPTTPLEKELAAYLKDMHKYLVDSGVERFDPKTKQWVSIGKEKNYFPRVWDKNTIRNDEAGFIKLLEPHVGASQAKKTFEALVNGDGSLELNENEHSLGFTPWAPAVLDRVFTFIDKTNAVDFAKYQNKDLTDIMTSYTQRAVHRAEYAKDFGNAGEVISAALEKAKNEGASDQEIETARKATMAMEGTLGHDFNPRLKEIMGGIVTYENIVLLPLALFTNLLDPLGVAIRSNDIKEAFKSFKYGLQGIADQIRGSKDDGPTEMAKLLGLIDEQNMLDAMGQVYNSMHMGKFLKKINSKFFKYNGMEMWNKRMRISAMMAAQRFVVKNQDNQRYMDELGITKADIHEMKDGTIALTRDQLVSAGLKPKDAAAVEKRIQAAVFKWVDGAVLRPNAAHRPIWGSDPRFQLIFHLKQFTFSFQNVILRRVGEELKHGNATPAWILASYAPFMFLSDVMKGSMTGTLKNSADLYNIASNSVARSGILGTQIFTSDAFSDVKHGKMPGTSFLGPAFDHLFVLLNGTMGPGSTNEVVNRTVPFAKLLGS